MKELLLRTITGISLIAIVPGSILLGPVPFLVITILVYGLSAVELKSLFRPAKMMPWWIMAAGAGLVIPLLFTWLSFHVTPAWLLLPALVWMSGYIWAGLPRSGLLLLLWLALPYASFFASGWVNPSLEYQMLLPFSIILLVWVNDTFSYVMGSLAGRHKMTPRLSPGKTWEGLAGGAIFTLLCGWIFQAVTGEYYISLWITLALLVVIFGLMGDLFESALKRNKQVKDTGRLLPGHGGILDRFDSLLFTAPAIYILMFILNQLR